MIPIQNVKKRAKALKESYSGNINASALLSNLGSHYNYESIKTLIENFQGIDPNTNAAFARAIELFEEACANESMDYRIDELTNIICEKALPKVRNAKQMQDFLNRKKGTIKHNIIGKVNGAISKAKVAVGMGATTNNASSNPDSKHQKLFKMSQKEQERRLKKVNECMDRMIEKASILESCDRIIGSRAEFNKRYNFGKVFVETAEDAETCVNEFCMLIDTFKMPFRAKFNVCLENIQYEFDRNGQKISRSELAKLITEYFMMSGSVYSKYQILDEASNDVVLDKISKCGERLKKLKATASIGAAVETFVTKASGDTMDVCENGKQLIVRIIVMLSKSAFIMAVGVGVIALLITLVFGLLILLSGVALIAIIDKDTYEELKHTANSAKGAKKRELMRLQKKIDSDKNSDMDIKESFITEEFMSNKYDMERILETNKFYSREDVRLAKEILDEKSYKRINSIDITETVLGIDEGQFLNKNSKAKELIIKLKNTPIKTQEAFKNCIRQMYTDSADNIIDQTPNILAILFSVIVVGGALSINVGLGLIAAMVHYFIGMNLKRSYVKKYITKFKNQKASAERRMDKMTDEGSKERCKKYIASLDDAITRLEQYEDNLYSDEENNTRKGYSSGNDEVDDLSKEFGESAIELARATHYATVLAAFREEMTLGYIRFSNINRGVLDALTECAINYGIIDKHNMIDALEERAITSKRDFMVWEATRAAAAKLSQNLNKEPSTDLQTVAEACESINSFFNTCHISESTVPINEMNFINSIKLLIDSGKRNVQNLSDQEKMASRTLDVSLEQLKSSMQNALKQESKEAVIRGQILPPASRIIKLAITSGIAFMIHPAIAIIGLLGVFAMSKGLRAKERQIVLDEIDTELQITEQYIDQAKQKNDMKSLRQLLNIQKKLMRQRDRLKYKMRVEYDEKTPDSYDKDK